MRTLRPPAWSSGERSLVRPSGGLQHGFMIRSAFPSAWVGQSTGVPGAGAALSVLLALLVLVPLRTLSAAPADAATTRIVSLVPSLTEMLFEVGAGELVVGASDYCNFPEAARQKPRVGGLLNPNLEKIILLRPTLVLLYHSQGDTAGKLQALGIPARLLKADQLADVFGNLDELGDVTGRSAEAAAVKSRLRQQLDEVRRKPAGRARIRCLVVVSRDPAELRNIYVSTRSHYVGELVEIAGGENVIAGAGAAVSKEQIIRADPDVIIDLSGVEGAGEGAFRAARDASWKQLSTVAAVQNGRVHYYSDPRALLPGVGAGKTAIDLHDILYPPKAAMP